MEYNPEILGKLLGMLMAYAVSSLGLLLAYINYRKRILKAEKAFSPLAGVLTAGIGAALLAVLAYILWILYQLPPQVEAEATIGRVAALQGTFLSEIGIPGGILVMSFIITWLLYRHFTRRHHGVGAAPVRPPQG